MQGLDKSNLFEQHSITPQQLTDSSPNKTLMVPLKVEETYQGRIYKDRFSGRGHVIGATGEKTLI